MEENTIQSTVNESKENDGFISWVIFTVKSFIFPCFSPSFFKTASKRNLIGVIAFFFLFAFVITFVPTLRVIIAMRGVGSEIQGAYERGELPTITIEDGIAKVDGSQPLVFESNRTLAAIDTTGKVNEIDTRSYNKGILLTQTEIHLVNEDGYQVLPLSELNIEFGNPIVLDKTQVLDLWRTVSIWITILAFVGILIWNSIVRLAYIALIGLVIWGIVSLMKKGIGFSPVLITGILANVPVMYLKFILSLVNISFFTWYTILLFFTLYTILLIIVWTLALWTVLKTRNADEMEKSMVAL
jgi:hypothetical protein